MKRSELRQMIREEYSRVINEGPNQKLTKKSLEKHIRSLTKLQLALEKEIRNIDDSSVKSKFVSNSNKIDSALNDMFSSLVDIKE